MHVCRSAWALVVLAAAGACTPLSPLGQDTGPRDCETRTAYYLDADGDQHGDAASVRLDCSPPEGYVTDSADCDDADPARAADCAQDSGGVAP